MMKVRRRIRRSLASLPPGLYTHSSPPTVVQPHPSIIRQWLRGGEVEKLEDVVLHGQGHKLLGEYSSDLKVRAFLKTVPAYLARIDMINDAVTKGNLIDLQALLHPTSASGVPRRRISSLALCRDQSGNGILHKAVYYGYTEMVKWLIENFPQTIHLRDREKRTPLHYCASADDVSYIWTLLTEAGAETNLVDSQGHTPAYYIDHPEELRLPSTPTDMPAGRFTSGRNGIVIKQSNIRIWIHDRDLGRLQQVVWEGHGAKLKTETSHQPTVRRFLNAIPYIMGTIKDTHSAVVKNDMSLLKRKTEDPVPRQIFISKDVNGLTPLHKAAGLGHTDIVQYILGRCPKAISIKDNEGRTPLHYAAILKDNGEMFSLLKDYGAEETIMDKKGKTASYYLQKPNELDSKLLSVIPEAPRTASIAPASWDWRLLNQDLDDVTDMKKPPTSNGDSAFEDMGQDEISEKQSPQPLLNSDEVPEPETPEDYPNPGYDIYQQDLDEGVGYEPEDFQDQPDTENVETAAADPLPDDDSTDENPRSPLYEEVEDSNPKEDAEDVVENTTTKGTVRSKDSVNGIGSLMKGVRIGSGKKKKLKHRLKKMTGRNENTSVKSKTKTLDNFSENEQKDGFGEPVKAVNRKMKYKYRSKIPIRNEKHRTKTSDISKLLKGTKIQKPKTLDEFKTLYNNSKGVHSILNTSNGKSSTAKKVTFGPPRNLKEITRKFIENESIKVDPLELKNEDGVKEWTKKFIENEKYFGRMRQGNPVRMLMGEKMGPKNWTQRFLENEKRTGRLYLQSKSPSANSITTEVIRDKIQTGSMEQLAEMVLRGEGQSLINYKSDNPDVQTFLNNVPTYMSKIEAVHSATREGDLRALQYSLDRRKFAVARENRSPLRLTPLHVAALYNRTSVLRFLAGRFPETLYARDLKGRTPLHYAATLRDNAHFYNLLITLGADKNFQDEDGKTAEYYLHNPDHVTHEQLLAEFEGEPPVTSAEDELTDKVEDTESSRKNNDDLATLDTLDRYILQLHNPLDAADTFYKLLKQCLNQQVFDKLKLRLTKLDHGLLDLLRPAFKSNKIFSPICVPDYESFVVFEELLLPLVKALNGIETDWEGKHPESQFFTDETDFEINLDKTGRILQYYKIECCRNLEDYSFPLNLTPLQLEAIENELTSALIEHYKTKDKTVLPEYFVEDFTGAYCSVCEIFAGSEIHKQLDFYNLLDPALEFEKNRAKHWPHGRGVYINPNGNTTIWINVKEHIKVITTSTEDDKELRTQNDAVTIREGFPVFNAEDGHYLASSLGEPLIKGLTEVANKRPNNPVVYLANYLLTFANTPKETQESKMLMASEEEGYEEAPETQERTEPEENIPVSNSAFKPTSRDEFGQTILHFAMSRSHGRNAVFQLLQELDTNIAFRDELYRTARDIAAQVNITENVQAVDKFVVSMAAKGEVERLKELLLEGYDHILDTMDENKTILEVASERGQTAVVNFLQSLTSFEDRREKLHRVIRLGSDVQVREMLNSSQDEMLALAKNDHSRCSLHIAVLNQQKDIAQYIMQTFPQAVHSGDNLMRTPLHYAMATDDVESLSQMLIRAGATRVVKDLKGRQPSYYFMNKSEILQLQDEEEGLRI